MLYESCVWKTRLKLWKRHIWHFFRQAKTPRLQTIDDLSQPAKFLPLPWNYWDCWQSVGKALFSSSFFLVCDFEIRGDVQGNWTRKTKIWHVPTAVIGSCIVFVRLQNSSSHEVGQGAKSKQGIVAQSLSGWQSTVFCILYEYMQIYVWDVNKVTFIYHC